jgi:uncharacterized membrane protein
MIKFLIFVIFLFFTIKNDYTINQIHNYSVQVERIINYATVVNKGDAWKACAEFCDGKI